MTSLLNVQEWLDQCMNQALSIWCEDPEIQEGSSKGVFSSVMKKSYVTYRIKYKQPGRDVVAVRHRYSEFESMRKDLCDRYHAAGLLVPALPPKHSMNSAAMTQLLGTDLQETFVKERILGLTIFCENIVRVPWLRHDNSWKAFLRPSSSIVTDMESNNIGYVQLRACLEQMELPYENTMGARVEGVREELIIMDKHVKLLLDRAMLIQKHERALQLAYDQFAAGLQGFCESEKVNVKALAGRTFNNDGHSVLQAPEMVSTTSKALSDFWECKVQANRAMDFYTGVTLVIVLEQELAMIDALKDLIKVHDDLCTSIQSVQNKMRSTNNPDNMRELGESLQEKKQELKIFYSGFMYFTLPLAARQRASNFRRFGASYVSCQTAQSYLLHKACEEFFKSSQMSSFRAIEESNKGFQLLQILPIPSIPAMGGEDSEGSEDEQESNAGGANVAIIPHFAIPNIRDTNVGTIQHIDNLTTSRNHHQISFSTSMNRIPRGLSLSEGSTGMSGLFARALLHDKGLSPNTLRAGVASAGENRGNAAKTMENAEGRVNPLAARRGSAVKNSLMLPTNTAPKDGLEQGIEVDMYGTRIERPEYVSLRDTPEAPPAVPSIPSKSRKGAAPVNSDILDDLLEGKPASESDGPLNKNADHLWADV